MARLRSNPCRAPWAAVLALALGACGEGEPTEVPVASVPLADEAGQCAAVFGDAFPDAPTKVCLYFDGAPCVLVGDLDQLGFGDCGADGAGCSVERGTYMKFCPEGAPPYDLEAEAGQTVDAQLYVVAAGLAGERPSYCSFEPPVDPCDGSTVEDQGTNGCLARMSLQYVVDEVDGTLRPVDGAPVTLGYSGYVAEELGLFAQDISVCPSLPEGVCPRDVPSCTGVSLELLLEGSATGQVRTVPHGEVCADARCENVYPNGRMVTISATADSGAVLTAFDATLGADGGDCSATFIETTTTATCSVTLEGSGQLITRFGYELAVGVNGLGQVTGAPGGVDGDGIDCAGNQTCREVYDQDISVTLTANETETDWQFSTWMGGPCAGESNPSCTVRMDQAHTVTALFGYSLELAVSGDGQITANPPGRTCTGAESPCVVTYGSGETTTLTAAPNPDSVFTGWGGDCAASGASPTCDLTMNAEMNVTATFAYEVRTPAAPGGTVTRDPTGLPCSSGTADECGAYGAGNDVSFIASPTGGWVFLDWTGCNQSAGVRQCTMPITEAVTVQGRFGRRLDLAFAGRGSAMLTPSVHGDCGTTPGADCFAAYADGDVVTVTAQPDTGWALLRFTGCTPVAGNPLQCRVTMDQAQSVGVVFGRQLDVATTGNGVVSSSPAGIDCGADCVEVFNNGAGVTLTATPDAGWAFEGWSGCTPDAQTPNQCAVTMSEARAVTANFGRAIAVTIEGNGTVQSTPAGISCSDAGGQCAATYVAGTAVTLDANPSPGWAFLAWAGCTPDAVVPTRCTTNLSQARNVTATFGRQLVVSTTGMGAVVTVNPSTGINCPGDCDEVYADGSSVTLRANAAGGWALVGWQNCGSINGNECTVTMNQARNVSATFGRNLDVTVVGGGQVGSTPAGINCLQNNVGDCSEAYVNGTTVTLDALPNAGWGFLGWTGCTPVAGVPTSCTVQMNAARAAQAQFGRQLTVATSGDGTVTSNPAGINCLSDSGGDCDEVYADGTTVVLTATPNGAAQFGGWAGCPQPSGTTCTINVNQPRSVTASFGAGVTVLIAAGQGTVQSTPPGISCPGDCNEVYNNNQNVRLDATPAAGWVVQSWAGCTQDGANPNRCTLTASGAGQTVTVRFGRQLDVSVTGGGNVTGLGINCQANGTPDCDEVYDNGQNVTLTANPNAGWAFLAWTGCTPGGNPLQCTVSMGAARSVTATFGRQLDITIVGGGTTSSNPVGVGCGVGCEVHPNNTTVTLTATPNNGFAVQSFTGCTPVGGNQCQVTMAAARAVTVRFGRAMTVAITGNGAVSSNPAGINCGADCDEVFNDGQNVTLTATPQANHALESWSGCTPVGGNPNQCTVAMTAARAVSAEFRPLLTVNAPTALAGETVTSNPAGVSCVGPACTDSQAFPPSTAVRLIASPGANRLVEWTGCTVVVGNEDQCDVTLNVPRTVTATFVDTFPLTVTFAGTGTGAVSLSQVSREGISNCNADCTVRYRDGTSVTVTPQPDANSVFDSFAGDCTGAACTVNMDQARSVTATFTP